MLHTVRALMLVAALPPDGMLADGQFTVAERGEVIATIDAGCSRCDWAAPGREAALLELSIDGAYSQHVVLTRGRGPAPYRVLLGPLDRGPHRLAIRLDPARSAKEVGAVTIDRVEIETFTEKDAEYAWLSRAPVLQARPGSVERFSDVPLLMYVERDVNGEGPGPYALQYTVVFSNEDGGTPPDRLMATWGRTTDIEFVYGVAAAIGSGGGGREVIQAEGHRWIDFAGPHLGRHPVLWVATENNMVADHGPLGAIRFAPAPEPVALAGISREAVMDAEPWTYAVTAAEIGRERRIDSAAPAGSGRIPDPRRFAIVEACAEVTDATFAFDIGVRDRGAPTRWYPTDRGGPAFRIARGGCVRGGAPLPAGVGPAEIVGVQVRAYTRRAREGEAPLRPGSGRVVLRRVTRIFMLDETFTPIAAPLCWSGEVDVLPNGPPVALPLDENDE